MAIDLTSESIKNSDTGMNDSTAKSKLEEPIIYTALIAGLLPEFYNYDIAKLYEEFRIQDDGSRKKIHDLPCTNEMGPKRSSLDINYLISGIDFSYGSERLQGSDVNFISEEEYTQGQMKSDVYLPRRVNKSIALRIFLDIEPQSSNLGESIFNNRGSFYNTQNILANSDTGKDSYDNIGKAYSLWLCKDKNDTMGFVNESGVYKSMIISGNFDRDTRCLSNVRDVNIGEVIVVSIPKLMKKLQKKNDEISNALYDSLDVMLNNYSRRGLERLSNIYKRDLRLEGEDIMDASVRRCINRRAKGMGLPTLDELDEVEQFMKDKNELQRKLEEKDKLIEELKSKSEAQQGDIEDRIRAELIKEYKERGKTE